MYGTPIQKIPINPPTESQMLFLSDGNTVAIKTKICSLMELIYTLVANLSKSGANISKLLSYLS